MLTEVFEECRNESLKNYKIDPDWFFAAPGLAWDTALKTSGVKLEFLTDIDMLLMLEKGLRGGISMISNGHGKDNNPYMGSDYDEQKPTKYNTYLDANNLYGCAMIQPLPFCKFEWLKKTFLFFLVDGKH